MRNYRYSKGFSMIELMIVVAIIGVLAAVAVPNYSKYMMRSRIAALLPLAEEGKIDVTSYIARTGDTNCSAATFVPMNIDYSVIDPNASITNMNTQSYPALSANTGLPEAVAGAPVCLVQLWGKASLFGGRILLLDMVAIPSTSNPGRITWVCMFFNPNSQQAAALPDGCRPW